MDLKRNSVLSNGSQKESEKNGDSERGRFLLDRVPSTDQDTIHTLPLQIRFETEVSGGNGPSEWGNSWEFILSCLSMSVGMGNLLRFPFAAVQNGGGAFLVPYLIVLVLIGYPMYFLELVVGQFSSRDPIGIWAMAPIFQGVGYSAIFFFFVLTTFYCAWMAITMRYFVGSFQSPLPWTVCPDEYLVNGTCAGNVESIYYKHVVLKEQPDILEGIGLPDIPLTLCLFAFWVIMYLSMVKGVKTSGKVAYVTAIVPYIILFILLVRGSMLKGAMVGIEYFLTPNFEKILSSEVWFAAVYQCFFSLNVAFGPIIIYGSYNKFSHNVYRDAMILCGMDTLTSLLAGLTVFTVVGYMSVETETPVQNVTDGGLALAFQTYPLIISKFEWAPQIFSVLFFLMLLTLGLGSGMCVVGIVGYAHKKFPKVNKWIVTGVFCLVSFLLGLPYVTPGGKWVLKLVDDQNGLLMVILGTLEVMGICWCYGLGKLVRDVEFMLDQKIPAFWKVCWGAVVPVCLGVLLIKHLSSMTALGPQFPPIATVCAWLFTSIGFMILGLGVIHAIFSQKDSTLWGKIKSACKPSPEWGPMRSKHRDLWLQCGPPKQYYKAYSLWVKRTHGFLEVRTGRKTDPPTNV